MNIFSPEIKNRIWNRFKDSFYFQRAENPILVRNINYDGFKKQPKVLLCYLEKGFFFDVEASVKRTILFEIFKMVKVFSELGFCIDLINCNDTKALKLIKDTNYHTIFGFGEAFYQITRLQPDAKSILYMTEHHPVFSYTEEKKRIVYFYDRHRKNVNLKRSGLFYKTQHLEAKYSHLITLSELEPYVDQYEKPYSIFPTGIINSAFCFNNQKHEKARKNFLWLGSNGAIHKGLDILVDVFSHRDDIILHICGMTSEDKALLQIPVKNNIIEYGHIDIQSPLFLKIVEGCSFVILPSCSEGFATSITTGMLHGLIPIVMRNTGFNRLEEKAIFLDDFAVETMDKKLTKISEMQVEELQLLSEKVYEFANQNFTLNSFEDSFREIISDIYTR